MSLDVWLEEQSPVKNNSSGIFIRENGQTKEISLEEWQKRYPGKKPIIVKQEAETITLFHYNITGNLRKMAEETNEIFEKALWSPDELNINTAKDLISYLRLGIAYLVIDKDRLIRFNPSNGWGNYDNLLELAETYLQACKDNPGATVCIWK